jgi:hypothetical protein
VGSQVPLEVGRETFYLDLLFYHVRLHCYFVIELKTGNFKPEWAGKLNFYLSAVDGLFRSGPDAPTIGLLLCETHSTAVVEYALQNIAKPIGVFDLSCDARTPRPDPRRAPERGRSPRGGHKAPIGDGSPAAGASAIPTATHGKRPS